MYQQNKNITWKYIQANFNEFYSKVARWTRREDLFEKSTIIFPMNEQQHWFLCVVTNLKQIFGLLKNGKLKRYLNSNNSHEDGYHLETGLTRADAQLKIVFLDSMRNPNKYKKRYEIMKKYIVEEAINKHKISAEEANLLEQCCVQQMPNVPQQQDGASCGLFMLEFIERILTDRDYFCGGLWDLNLGTGFGTFVESNSYNSDYKCKLKEVLTQGRTDSKTHGLKDARTHG